MVAADGVIRPASSIALLLLATLSPRVSEHVPGHPHGNETVMLPDEVLEEMLGPWSTYNPWLPQITVVRTARRHSQMTLHEQETYMREDQRAVLYSDSTAWTMNPRFGVLSRWRWLNLLFNQALMVMQGEPDAAANLNAGDDTLPVVIYKDAFVAIPIHASKITHFSYLPIETQSGSGSVEYFKQHWPTARCFCVGKLQVNTSQFVIKRRWYTGELEYTAWKERVS
jgi:hypothetical protein